MQSDKSIGRLNFCTGEGVLNNKGSYFPHLHAALGAEPFTFPGRSGLRRRVERPAALPDFTNSRINDAQRDDRMATMRTTVTLDDELVTVLQDDVMPEIARGGISALLNEVMRLAIQMDAARRLAALGGTVPDLELPPRRRRS